MNCPSCENKIQIWKLRSHFACSNCDSHLIITNYTTSLVIVFIGWVCIISPLAWILGEFICRSYLLTALIDITIGPLLAITIFLVAIKVKTKSKDSIKDVT